MHYWRFHLRRRVYGPISEVVYLFQAFSQVALTLGFEVKRLLNFFGDLRETLGSASATFFGGTGTLYLCS